MRWQPSEEVDEQIRRWMKTKGWEMTRTNYDADRQIYAWRHDVRGASSPTLRIARYVLEHYPAFVVLYHLDQLKVAQAIRSRPAARLIVLQNVSKVTLDEMRPHLKE